jgi:hypothetical protein
VLQYDKEKNRAGFADTDCNAIKPVAQVRLQLGPADALKLVVLCEGVAYYEFQDIQCPMTGHAG